jgi:uncharacterized protein YjlB
LREELLSQNGITSPPGQHWDMNYGEVDERPRADQNIARVPLPHTDPVFRKSSPLIDHWLDQD